MKKANDNKQKEMEKRLNFSKNKPDLSILI